MVAAVDEHARFARQLREAVGRLPKDGPPVRVDEIRAGMNRPARRVGQASAEDEADHARFEAELREALGRLEIAFPTGARLAPAAAPAPPPDASDDRDISASGRCPGGQKGCVWSYALPDMAAEWLEAGGVASAVVKVLYEEIGMNWCGYASCSELDGFEDYTNCRYNQTYYDGALDGGGYRVYHRCCCRSNPASGGPTGPVPWTEPWGRLPGDLDSNDPAPE